MPNTTYDIDSLECCRIPIHDDLEHCLNYRYHGGALTCVRIKRWENGVDRTSDRSFFRDLWPQVLPHLHSRARMDFVLEAIRNQGGKGAP